MTQVDISGHEEYRRRAGSNFARMMSEGCASLAGRILSRGDGQIQAEYVLEFLPDAKRSEAVHRALTK